METLDYLRKEARDVQYTQKAWDQDNFIELFYPVCEREGSRDKEKKQDKTRTMQFEKKVIKSWWHATKY